MSCSEKSIKAKDVTILVDRTVEDSAQLLMDVKSVRQVIINKILSDEDWILATKFTFAWIDDLGEGGLITQFAAPSSRGIQKSNIKKTILNINRTFEEIESTLKTQTHTFTRSLILEPIKRSLLSSDIVYVVSDMAIVDSERNFEAMNFGNPVSLVSISKGKDIVIFRVRRPGQDLRKIKMIEAWWDSALYGKNKEWELAQVQSMSEVTQTIKKKKQFKSKHNARKLYLKWFYALKPKLIECQKFGGGKIELDITIRSQENPTVVTKSSNFKLSQCVRGLIENEKFPYSIATTSVSQSLKY
jgi:hypothetical protein